MGDAAALNQAKGDDFVKLLDSRVTEDLGAQVEDFDRMEKILKSMTDNDAALKKVVGHFNTEKLDNNDVEDLEALEPILAHMEEVKKAIAEFKKFAVRTHAKGLDDCGQQVHPGDRQSKQ